MRFATIAILATAVAADDTPAKKMLPSALTTFDFASDNADEKASMSFLTNLIGEVESISGTTTVSSKAKDINSFRFSINIKGAEVDTTCLAKYTVYSGNVDGATEVYTTSARAAKADQLNCNNGNDLIQLVSKGNMDDGVFNQLDKEYLTTEAKRTQKRSSELPAVATTTWSRPSAESTGKAFIALPIDTEFQSALSWRADDQNRYSRTAAADAIVWKNAKILKLVKPKSASALQMGAAALVLATASLL